MKTNMFSVSMWCAVLASVVFVTAAPADIPLGVRAWWKFDEGSGTIAHDSSGNGFDAAFYGNPQWVPGLQGSAVELLDYDQAGDIPSSVDDSFQNAFTITAWVYWYGPSGYHPLCYLFDARGPEIPCASGFMVYVRTDGRFSFLLKVPPGLGLDYASLSSIPLNTWTHVAAVFNHATQTVTLYVNGIEDNVMSSTTLYYETSLNPAIGNNLWGSPPVPFNGVVDELRLYEWALTADDVHQLYCLGALPADMNCDCQLNFDDIDPFVLALTDPAEYAVQYPNCDWHKGDLDGDGYVTFHDIDPFVALLSGGD
jgi:hypothetical protein